MVHDEVYLLIGWQLRFQMVQELDEFAAAMTLLTRADHFAVENIALLSG